MVRDQRNDIHPFSYIDRCLPIADWNDAMCITKGIDLIIEPQETIEYDKELKEWEAAAAINKQKAKELTWAKQHVLWLYNKHKHLDQHGMLPVQCRIRAMTMRSRLRRDDWAKRYEQHTDEESDEDG